MRNGTRSNQRNERSFVPFTTSLRDIAFEFDFEVGPILTADFTQFFKGLRGRSSNLWISGFLG